ncbi:relaxase/mobilization nuclease domain-containing protein [Chamaesiphon polymorphus]|uniref:Relaxase/mobilization nuclease n=1 Tax=Chamaesiphon polymorphus CCALA 037 TaxID=2107692 RepID=A0A2T1GFD7_9CYAN|nr:relaxase/mobilization nuclease domain-containing protein [Chamaesiphon polymorphus]PSB56225.1 relaxase/mobilization nuclease [Chamaesiphon polymorphus CCALA 037]
MTIANITKGRGFGGLMGYLLDPAKKPRIISSCVASCTPADLAREFRLVANLRPSVTKPVRHFSIAFAPADGRVDDVIKEAVAFRVLDGLGYEDCQFIAIDHDRDDPGHDYAHDHDHIHVVTNAVTVLGEYVTDSFDRYKIQTILRELERDFGLHQITSSWELKHQKAQGLHLNTDIARLVANSLQNCPNLQTWLDRLAEFEIDVRFNIGNNDRIKGVTFLKDDRVYKGGDIGSKWSVVSQQIPITDRDLALMQAVNIKSQEKPVRLSEIDSPEGTLCERAMFDRAVEMAVMKLGRGKKFKNSRADITLDGDTLTVVRMRPHRLMFKATQTKDGKWEPVGFPHVEKRDVEQLERFNGVESKKFETPLEHEALEVADEFIRVAACVVSDLDQEQDFYEEEGLSM